MRFNKKKFVPYQNELQEKVLQGVYPEHSASRREMRACAECNVKSRSLTYTPSKEQLLMLLILAMGAVVHTESVTGTGTRTVAGDTPVSVTGTGSGARDPFCFVIGI